MDKRTEGQFQMSDGFYREFVKYLKDNKMSLKSFCEKHNLSYYYTQKVVDRRIKAYAYERFLERLASFAMVKGVNLFSIQPTLKLKK